MKLKKLTIRNIASITTGEIDFTKAPLNDAPIFLICGETGSGKTTILDAICLALYDRTPRLNNKKASPDTQFNDNGQDIDIKKVVQLLKKGETEGSICLLFEGVDGNAYRADWSCKIKPRAHTIDNEVWTITDASGIQKTATDKIMESITGMDFDQFCRTSMLAQGEFTAFLKAENDKKSDILEKITGTEIYARIGKRIHDRYLDAKRDYDEAVKAAGSIVLLPPEEAEQYASDIASIKKKVDENTITITGLEKLISAYENIERESREKEDAEKKREKGKSTFKELCEGLAFDEKTFESDKEAKVLFDNALRLRDRFAPMYEKSQTIVTELDNVSRQEKIKASKENDRVAASKTLAGLTSKQSGLKAKRDDAMRELASRQDALKKAKEEREKLAPEAVEDERKAIARVSAEISSAKIEWAKIGTDNERLAADLEAIIKLRKEVEADEASLAELAETAKAAKDRFDVADIMYQKQKECTDQFVADLRERLRELEAEECPVCHSRITRLPTQEEEENNLRPVREEWERLKGEWNSAEENRHKAEIALGVKKRTVESSKRTADNLRIDIDKAGKAFSEKYASLFSTDCEDMESALTDAENALKTRSDVNEKAISMIQEQDKLIERYDKEAKAFEKNVFEPARKAVEDGDKAMIAAKGEEEKAAQGIRDAQTGRDESFGKAAALILYPDWETIWNEDRKAFNDDLTKAAMSYHNDLAESDKRGEGIKLLEDSIRTALEIRDSILKDNPDFLAEDLSPVRFRGNAAVSWGALKQSIEGHNSTIRKSTTAIEENRIILGKAFEGEDGETKTKDELILHKVNLTNESKEKSALMGSLDEKLKANEKAKIDLGNKEADRDAKKVIFEKWLKLNRLFGGDDGVSFKKIAQSYIMQDILNHANGYLSKIAPRYELLAQPGSLIILVKDTEDNIIRSGNTLSGGEGFVVSLALALGLSSLAESSISADTIFIDEGFGTLSHDWLNNVMNTLEKLNSTSGKHIGMITHMEELQKKIPVFIKVERTDASSSTISVNP